MLLKVNPESNLAVTESLSLAKDQQKDTQIRKIVDYLERGVLPNDDTQATLFMVMDGVLYFLDPHKKDHRRVVVPTHLQTEVIKIAHGGLFGGHFSGNRVHNMLSRTLWWEKMYADILSYCKSCPNCPFVSGGGRVGQPPLHPIHIFKAFQILGMDVMELPKTDKGNGYVLVIQDFLTKWPLVFPMPDQKTIRIVKILVEEIIPLFGVPEAILSDRGTNLLPCLMKDVCELLGIKKLNTTAYHRWVN